MKARREEKRDGEIEGGEEGWRDRGRRRRMKRQREEKKDEEIEGGEEG